MDLQEKISLIDALIRENPDYTIRDYLDVVTEIEGIGRYQAEIDRIKKLIDSKAIFQPEYKLHQHATFKVYYSRF